MIHGVYHENCGFSLSVIKKNDKKEDILKKKCIMNTAILVGDIRCKNLVAASIYDNKPVYFISNICEEEKEL